MAVTTRERGVLAGVCILVIAGSGLIVAAPAGPTGPPAQSGPVAECELVQLAVYELDGTPRGDQEPHPYRSLGDGQQAVFDEARAANGAFVRFHDPDRMTAADALAPYVVFDGRTYRAHSVRGNCPERPWYGGLLEPLGMLLVGIAILVGSVVAWRRITY